MRDLLVFRRGWLADTSWKSAKTAMRAYLLYCRHYDRDPVPATGITDLALAGFIFFLVRDPKAFSTVKTYLSMGPRVLQQLRLGTWTPNAERPMVLHTLRAARRALGDAPQAKLPITPDMLRGFAAQLDLNDPGSVVLYTSFLVAFFAFLRKSNLVPGKASDFNNRLVLRRSDVTFDADGRAWLTLRATKTIQFQERTITLPLALLADATICPSTWLRRMMALDIRATHNAPLFSLPGPRGKPAPVLTYSIFLSALKKLLTKQGYDVGAYAGQSFRRGGATFALSSGVATEFIKMQGDWHSDAYLLYATVTRASQLTAVQIMGAALDRG